MHMKLLQPKDCILQEVEGEWQGQSTASSHLTDFGTIHPDYALPLYAKIMPKD